MEVSSWPLWEWKLEPSCLCHPLSLDPHSFTSMKSLVVVALLAALAAAAEVGPKEKAEIGPDGCPQPQVNVACDWVAYHFEEYEKGGTGWSNNEVSECDCKKLLGGYGKFGSGEITKSFEGLPQHDMLNIRSNVFFLDDWNRETVFFKVDDKIVWSGWSHGREGWVGINACGDPRFPDYISQPVNVVIPHKGDQLKIGMGSNVNHANGPLGASWGISFLSIHTCAI